MEYWQIGMEDVESLKITGLEQLSGRLFAAISTNERTSFTASSMLLPHSNSSVTTEMLSLDSEVMCLR